MPCCPECGAEIDHISLAENIRMYWNLLPNGEWDQIDDSNTYPADDPDSSYECPECCAHLFDTQEEALDFLNNKGVTPCQPE